MARLESPGSGTPDKKKIGVWKALKEVFSGGEKDQSQKNEPGVNSPEENKPGVNSPEENKPGVKNLFISEGVLAALEGLNQRKLEGGKFVVQSTADNTHLQLQAVLGPNTLFVNPRDDATAPISVRNLLRITTPDIKEGDTVMLVAKEDTAPRGKNRKKEN